MEFINGMTLFLQQFWLFLKSNVLLWIICFCTLLLSVILIKIVIFFCDKYKIYDSIDERKVHTGQIPRLGSIGFVTSFTIGSIMFCILEKEALMTNILPFIIAGFIIFLFGVIDDFKNLPAKIKLLFQIIAAAVIVFNGYRFKTIGSFTIPLWFSYILTFGWIIGIINSFNLIDGIDGLCGGLSSLAILTIGLILSTYKAHSSAVCFILVFSVFGFLIYNNPWPKAKIFMGDGGSQFLGFMVAVLPLYESTPNFEYNKFLIMLVLVSIPMIDTIAAIWRRLREHRPIMSPDKLHLHHKFMNLGLNSRQILRVLLLVQLILCLITFVAMGLRGFKGFCVLLVTFVLVIVLFGIVHFKNKKYLANLADSENKPVQN